MRFCLRALALAGVMVGMGCATRDPGMVKTQVVTFPEGALVEYNGKVLGRAPAEVVFPQDAQGRLIQRAVVRALPNTEQERLYAQSRVFDPSNRIDRVPSRVMIDMRLRGTNEVFALADTTHVERESKSGTPRRRIPVTERGKPTQAVGLDRWNPGKY